MCVSVCGVYVIYVHVYNKCMCDYVCVCVQDVCDVCACVQYANVFMSVSLCKVYVACVHVRLCLYMINVWVSVRTLYVVCVYVCM